MTAAKYAAATKHFYIFIAYKIRDFEPWIRKADPGRFKVKSL